MRAPAGVAKCISCGADCDPRTVTCWLCYSAQSNADANPYTVGRQGQVENAGAGSTQVVNGPYTIVDYCFLFLLIGCVVLTFLIGLGIVVDDPNATIGFVVLVAPAYIITTLRTWSRAERTGAKPRPARMLATLLLSFTATVGIIFLLGLAAMILLFAVCFGIIGSGGIR